MKWYKATVPGTVHTDLFSNKLIPDPFFGDNEKQLQWIEGEDWEYQTVFKISEEELLQSHIELQFAGLDTYAKVYVNDSLVLEADNMFRSWNVDVKKYIHKGKNKLLILFESAVKKGKEEAKKISYTLPGDEKVFTRKAQYQYGWDWGPRFVTCGIWKDVKLVSWSDARILNIKAVQKSLTDSLAQLEFVCEIKSDVEANVYLDISRGDNDLSGQMTNKIALKKGIDTYTLSYSIKNPQLWWCNG
ncbi:MAG: glycoside hydrolase family 2 protein, partial [Bacteroidetes bacterium]|nr:glycoside hydrolase family 2 protein [Bacteroidota bacterium]